MATEKIGVEMMVQPTLDQKAAKQVIKDANDLRKQLSAMKVDWSSISKQAGNMVSELKKISTSSSDFAKQLKKSTSSAVEEIRALEASLKGAASSASTLQNVQVTGAQKVSQESANLEKIASSLGASIKTAAASQKKLDQASKEAFRSKIADIKKEKQAARMEWAKMLKREMPGLLSGKLEKTLGSFGRVFGGTAKMAGKQAGFGLKTKLPSGMGGMAGGAKGAGKMAGAMRAMGSTMGALSKAVPHLTVAITALSALWTLIKNASESMTKLNKSILEGAAGAKDMGAGANALGSALDNTRNATIVADRAMMQFGGRAGDSAKIFSSYMRESSGSLQETNMRLIETGGTLEQGMIKLATSAQAYGNALGMSAAGAAEMMGKLESEMGITGDRTYDAMDNIVKAAATANMPMTKFMGIFRTVLPDVEMYKNRLEELTGVVKMLSRTMDARAVKQFMSALAKGFKGTDFKQRLKSTLIVGTGRTRSNVLDSSKRQAGNFASQLSQYGISRDDIYDAMTKGTGSMADLLARAQEEASRNNATIAPALRGAMMDAASYTASAQRGGALELATSLRGVDMYGMYKQLQMQSQAFTTGFSGLAEHVIKQTGVTEEQYEMLRKMDQSQTQYAAEIRRTGMTSSSSMNDALAELIAVEMSVGGRQVKASEVTLQDIKNFSQNTEKFNELLWRAGEISNKSREVQVTAKDMAAQTATATISIADKIENLIANILQSIYSLIYDWLVKPLDQLVRLTQWGFTASVGEQLKLTAAMESFDHTLGQFADGSKEQLYLKSIRDALTTAQSMGKSSLETSQDVFSATGAAHIQQYTQTDQAKSYARLIGQSRSGQDSISTEEMEAEVARMREAASKGTAAFAAYFEDATKNMDAEMRDRLRLGIGMATAKGDRVTQEDVAGLDIAAAGVVPGRREGAKEEPTVAANYAELVDRARASDTEQAFTSLSGNRAGLTLAQARSQTAGGGGAVVPSGGATSGGATSGGASSGQSTMSIDPTQSLMSGDMSQGYEALASYDPSLVSGASSSSQTTPVRMGTTTVDHVRPEAGGAQASSSGQASGGSSSSSGSPAEKEQTKKIETLLTERTFDAYASSHEGWSMDLSSAIKELNDSSSNLLEEIKRSNDGILQQIRQGLKLDSSFVKGDFQNTIKDSTLESFRTALLEHAIIMARIQAVDGFAAGLSKYGEEATDVGLDKIATSRAFRGTDGAMDEDAVGNLLKQMGRSRAMGGPIPDTGVYYLHKGEHVLNPDQTAAMRSGGGTGGKTTVVHANVTINGTQLSQRGLQTAVHGAIDELSRRH